MTAKFTHGKPMAGTSANSIPDGVVLLHGIFRTKRSMASMARFLEREGFRVLNLGYPSTKHTLEGLADHIQPQIEQFAKKVKAIHFVGYSMGGLVIRVYINRHRPANLGRVVMVGTPNGGSECADTLQHVGLYKKFYGPAGQQLITDQQEFAHIFGKVDYDAGVIAGNFPLDFIASYIIGKPNDGKVSVESTHLPGQKAHKVIHADHTFFPTNRTMWKYALQFLKEGTFG